MPMLSDQLVAIEGVRSVSVTTTNDADAVRDYPAIASLGKPLVFADIEGESGRRLGFVFSTRYAAEDAPPLAEWQIEGIRDWLENKKGSQNG